MNHKKHFIVWFNNIPRDIHIVRIFRYQQLYYAIGYNKKNFPVVDFYKDGSIVEYNVNATFALWPNMLCKTTRECIRLVRKHNKYVKVRTY